MKLHPPWNDDKGASWEGLSYKHLPKVADVWQFQEVYEFFMMPLIDFFQIPWSLGEPESLTQILQSFQSGSRKAASNVNNMYIYTCHMCSSICCCHICHTYRCLARTIWKHICTNLYSFLFQSPSTFLTSLCHYAWFLLDLLSLSLSVFVYESFFIDDLYQYPTPPQLFFVLAQAKVASSQPSALGSPWR